MLRVLFVYRGGVGCCLGFVWVFSQAFVYLRVSRTVLRTPYCSSEIGNATRTLGLVRFPGQVQVPAGSFRVLAGFHLGVFAPRYGKRGNCRSGNWSQSLAAGSYAAVWKVLGSVVFLGLSYRFSGVFMLF